MQVRYVGFADVDRVGELDEQISRERCGEADGVKLLLGLGVADEHRDKSLCDACGWAGLPPRLAEREEHLRAGRDAIGEGVVLEARAEVGGIVKDLRAILLVQWVALRG